MHDGSGAALLYGAHAWAEAVTFDALLGADNIEADWTEPRPDGATGGPCLDLVVHTSCPRMLGLTAPGDAVPTPGFSGAVDPGTTRNMLIYDDFLMTF
jgi:hypothetical protein